MAARDIYLIHTEINFILRKERGGFITDTEIDNMLDMGQKDVFAKYWQEYLRTGVLPDCLEVFKKRFSFSFTTSVGGLVTKPTDYEKFLNLKSITYNNTLGLAEVNAAIPLNEDEIAIAQRSQLRKITKQKPKIVQGANNFVLYPQEPQAGYVNYLKTPAVPFASISYVGRLQSYNAGASTQLEWRDGDVNEVILASLSYIGINLNEQQLTAYAEAKEKEV